MQCCVKTLEIRQRVTLSEKTKGLGLLPATFLDLAGLYPWIFFQLALSTAAAQLPVFRPCPVDSHFPISLFIACVPFSPPRQ
jgi:hypothetical protein